LSKSLGFSILLRIGLGLENASLKIGDKHQPEPGAGEPLKDKAWPVRQERQRGKALDRSLPLLIYAIN
jgi:hypothetical protein